MPKKREEIIAEVKADLDKLPSPDKATKEDYRKFVEKLVKIYASDADKSYNDTPATDAANEFLESLFKSKTGVVSPEEWQRIVGINEAFLEYMIPLKVEQGIKIDQMKKMVMDKEIPGTEYLLDSEGELKSKLAKNLYIAQNKKEFDTGKGLDLAYNMFFQYANESSVMSDVEEEKDGIKQTVKKNVPCTQVLVKLKEDIEDKYFEGKYKDYKDKRAEYFNYGLNFDENCGGFKVNMDYYEGDPYINEYPEDLMLIMTALNGKELREEWEKQKDMIDSADLLEKNARQIADNAKLLLEELDAVVPPENTENPEEYVKMRAALEKVAKTVDPVQDEVGADPRPARIYRDELEKNIKNMWRAAHAYQIYASENSSFIYEDEEYEKKREGLSKRIKSLAEVSKPLTEKELYKFPDTFSHLSAKYEANNQLKRIDIRRNQLNLPEFTGHKVKGSSIAEKIAAARAHGEKAKENVTLGSKKYDKAIASLDTIAEAYKQIQTVKDDKELDINVRRALIIKAMDNISKSKDLMNDYMERKRRQGKLQAGATADYKSQKRINAVREGLDIVSSIEHEVADIREAMYNEDIQMENEIKEEYKNATDRIDVKKRSNMEIAAVKKALTEQANTQKGYLKTSAQYALEAMEMLDTYVKSAKSNNLTAKSKTVACRAMAAIVYYDMIRNMPKKTIEKMQSLNNMAQNESDLSNTLDEFADSEDFTRLISGGGDNGELDIDTNTIEEFLCDPSKYSERIISNRKAVNKIKDNVADKQLSEDILRPVKLDRAINLWK